MKELLVFSLALSFLLTSCSKPGDGSTEVQVASENVILTCDYPRFAETSIGSRIRIRGKMTLHAHGVLFEDVRCPGVMVHLMAATDGPDLTLCNSPELGYGCPAGSLESGPIVTAVGILDKKSKPDNGMLLVEQLVDFANALDAKSK